MAAGILQFVKMLWEILSFLFQELAQSAQFKLEEIIKCNICEEKIQTAIRQSKVVISLQLNAEEDSICGCINKKFAGKFEAGVSHRRKY